MLGISKNIVFALIAFLLNGAISFFMAPIYISLLGIESYGHIALAIQMVGYLGLFSIALNSMAITFISREIANNNFSQANIFYSSVLFGNIVMTLILLVLVFLGLTIIDLLIVMEDQRKFDLQILYSFIFLNFIITNFLSILNFTFYASKKLYLKSKFDIFSKILFSIVILVMINIFNARVYFHGVAMFISSIVLFIVTYISVRRLTPSIKFSIKWIKLNVLKILIQSGMWNSLTSISSILLIGLDLIIVNSFFGPELMGIFAITKMIPSLLISMIGVLGNVFAPDFLIFFSQERNEALRKVFTLSVKIIALLVNLSIILFAFFGETFFKLWLPESDNILLYNLTLLTLIPWIINGPLNSFFEIFVISGKLKSSSLAIFFSGISYIIIIYLGLSVFHFSIYFMILSSGLIGIVRTFVFTVPVGSHIIGLDFYSIYKLLAKSSLVVLFIGIPLFFLRHMLLDLSFISLVVTFIFLFLIVLIINALLIFDNLEIRRYINGIKRLVFCKN